LLNEKGVRVFELNSLKNNRLSLKQVLKILAKEKITSLLVEGGADIFTQFVEKNLFDELIILQTPKVLGKGISSQNINKIKRLKLINSSKLGNDVKLVYERMNDVQE
jgi:diaminohydroxyphosphoribosylaminopyrimidine deaminase/5-amino-6-(5-phosphoribosylamino)uracil reductase